METQTAPPELSYLPTALADGADTEATGNKTLNVGDKLTFQFSNVTIMEDFSFSIKINEQ